MKRLGRLLEDQERLTENRLETIVEDVLAEVHTKYIDPENQHTLQIFLILGAVCSDGELHLISTQGRSSQFQDAIAYAGAGSDIAIFLVDRLHRLNLDWEEAAKVAGFTLEQVNESCQDCSGPTEIFVMQQPPEPRWRYLGDVSINLFNEFGDGRFGRELSKIVLQTPFYAKEGDGYCDELNPEPVPDPFD
jgi:hypothetical protein